MNLYVLLKTKLEHGIGFLKHINRFKHWTIGLLLLLYGVVSLLDVGALYVTKDVIDSLSSENRSYAALLVLTTIVSLSIVGHWASELVTTLYKTKNEENAKVVAMNSVINRSITEYESESFQRKLEFIKYNLGNTIFNFVNLLKGLFSSIVTIITLLVAIGMLTPYYSLLIVIILIIPVAIFNGYVNRSQVQIELLNSYDSIKTRYFKSIVLNKHYASEIVLYNAFSFLGGKWKRHFESVNEREYARDLKNVKLNLFINLIQVVGFMIYLSTLLMFLSATISPGELFFLITSSLLLVMTSQNIVSQVQMMFLQSDLFKTFGDAIVYKDTKAQQSSSVLPPRPREIIFKEVSFFYKNNPEYLVLKELNLTIEIGKHIALIGPNGSGKTTFYYCLLGLLKPTSGKITIDGREPHTFTDEERARLFSALFQHPIGYRGLSLLENVTLGRELDSIDSVDSFFDGQDLHSLYGGDLGGVELSGGQLQKLAVARGILAKGNILILDEPTASLDPVSEQDIVDRCLRLAKGKTLILSTHRMAITLKFDRVIVLDHGRIVEDDCPKTLLNRGSMYKRMFDTQGEVYKKLGGERA
ncbi:putative ABC transporter permease [Paenibacillus sp. 598K]|uniref:ATP-binding cassette domain-containing protein n=1 Tax=Paenibacillus sp. 598K TaxID=1117987 RepID=UPI000FFA0D52|nr:ABC transporter ATP-binding protein [Paenibacillus sp. 598K]GBF75271.1 putative ABC transporter permease [Paenibacillus sp. 598K]